MSGIAWIRLTRYFLRIQRYMMDAQFAGTPCPDRHGVVVDKLNRQAAAVSGALQQMTIGDRNEIGRQRSGGQSDQQLWADPRRLTRSDGKPG